MAYIEVQREKNAGFGLAWVYLESKLHCNHHVQFQNSKTPMDSAWGFLLEHLSKDWVKSVATSIFYIQSIVQTGLLMNDTLSLYVSLYTLISIVYPFLFLILETRTKKTFSEFSRAAWKQGVFFPSEAKHTRNSFSKNPSQLKIKTLFCHFIHHWEIPFGKWICTKQIASEKNLYKCLK